MTRTKSHIIASALLATMAFAGAPARGWAQDVETDFDPGTNFAAFRTYYWAKADPVPGNDIASDRIVTAVDRWLTAKGWSKAPEGLADVAVAAHVTTQQRQSIDTFYDGGLGGWGWGGWGGMATTTVRNYLEGTLIVDLFNKKTNKLIWRGTATDTVSDDPQKNARHIQKAVEKMFKDKFPPGLVDN